MARDLLETSEDPTGMMVVAHDAMTHLPDPVATQIWCPVISVDDHAYESADTFARVPAKHRDTVPEWLEVDGRPAWRIGRKVHFLSGLDGASGRPLSELCTTKMRLTDFRRGVWDPAARVADMDVNGVWASLNFPSALWGFAGTTLSKLPDPEAALAAVQSYNDWVVEDWCGPFPDRFIACQLPFLADPELAATEIRRNAARGVRAVSFSENPSALGYPSIHTDHWNPFFAACAETGTVVNLHIGSSGRISNPSPDTPAPAWAALFSVNGIETVIDWVFSPVPALFPDLKIVLSEAGVSWVPMVIEKLHRAHRQRDWAPHTWHPKAGHPVDTLRRNFWFTSIEDPSGLQQLDLIGEDRVMLEVDYPHPDSSWPDSQELFRSELESLPTSTVRKLCFENAAALYQHPLPPVDMIASSVVGRAHALN